VLSSGILSTVSQHLFWQVHMQIPLEVSFRNMDASPALEARARALATNLEKFSSQIIHCHVTIEAPHQHHHQGNLFSVHVRVTVPGREIAIHRNNPEERAHEDAYVALRDAFKAMRRNLQDYERERRGDVKTHSGPAAGRVCEINHERSFGRIETHDGRLVYFHGNSVLGRPFKELGIGAEVRFVEEPGELGPQASTVHA
jgi:ribosome-associated translation inhibitor RaiA/cold shock CspA family protein